MYFIKQVLKEFIRWMAFAPIVFAGIFFYLTISYFLINSFGKSVYAVIPYLALLTGCCLSYGMFYFIYFRKRRKEVSQ